MTKEENFSIEEEAGESIVLLPCSGFEQDGTPNGHVYKVVKRNDRGSLYPTGEFLPLLDAQSKYPMSTVSMSSSYYPECKRKVESLDG
ncbi:MAG: hypothetical protein AB1352_04825 [Patescibacteria group bacterium]